MKSPFLFLRDLLGESAMDMGGCQQWTKTLLKLSRLCLFQYIYSPQLQTSDSQCNNNLAEHKKTPCYKTPNLPNLILQRVSVSHHTDL
jgi:hypothetical protein